MARASQNADVRPLAASQTLDEEKMRLLERVQHADFPDDNSGAPLDSGEQEPPAAPAIASNFTETESYRYSGV